MQRFKSTGAMFNQLVSMGGKNYLSRREFLGKSLYLAAGIAGLYYGCSAKREPRIFIGTPEEIQAIKQSSQPATYRSTTTNQRSSGGRPPRGDSDNIVIDHYNNPSTGTIIEREIVRDALEGDEAAREYVESVIKSEKVRIRNQRDRIWEMEDEGKISGSEEHRRIRELRARDDELEAIEKYVRSRDDSD
jgi:hypothetical protein